LYTILDAMSTIDININHIWKFASIS
jgi:hypothetical protein